MCEISITFEKNLNMSAIPVSNKPIPLTVEEYFKLDEDSEIRYEFNEGFLKPIDGTSARHNRIVDNAKDVVKSVFRPRGCSVFTESVKLEVLKSKHYAFPDVMLTCHGFDLHADYLMHFPSLVIEVLSPSTADYDRGTKFKRYQNIPSLDYYLLIEQKQCLAELYCRTENPRKWTYQVYTEIEDIIDFPKLNFSLALREVYEGVTFDSPENWD